MTHAVKQWLDSNEDNEEKEWCNGRWYTFTRVNGVLHYIRNDGKLFLYMAGNGPTDINGGTYFLTQQEAQDCLDRYNAAQNDQNQDTQT